MNDTLSFTMLTQEKSISHCALLWIDLTPGPEAPKIITNIFLQKNTAFGQSFFPKTLKDWNKLDNETKESSTTVQSLDLTPLTLPLTQQQPPSRHNERSLRRISQEQEEPETEF